MVIFIVWMFRTKTNLESHIKLCENKDFPGVVMFSKGTKILLFNQYQKSGKTPSIIYADLESLVDSDIDGFQNNSEKSSITKIDEHISCGYLMNVICTFNSTEKKA